MKFKTIEIRALLIERDIPESDVPCQSISCTQCCEKLSPYLTEDEFRSGQYIYTFIRTPDPAKPAVAIPKISSGCIYFDSNKTCSIYDRRPLACRQFDCRQEHSPIVQNQFVS